MSPNIVSAFASHLTSKNYIVSELSLASARDSENNSELSLRKLGELTDLSAHDFADEVGRFYGRSRVGLPELIAASPVTSAFSRRFLRETTVFPYRSADGRYRLAPGAS